MTTVPRWDLAPKLDRLLSLWKPQDYALIIYWVLFFPQALKWYERTYCDTLEPDLSLLQWLGKLITTPSGKFWLQIQLANSFFNLSISSIVGFSLTFAYQSLGYEVNWIMVFFGIVVCVVFSLVVGRKFGGAENEVRGIGLSMTFAVMFVVFGGMSSLGTGEEMFSAKPSAAVGLVLGLVVGLVFGLALGLATSGGEENGIVVDMALGSLLGLVVGGVFSVVFGIMASKAFGWVVGVGGGFSCFLSFLTSFFHLWDYAQARVYTSSVSRLTWFRLPPLVSILSVQLAKDYLIGLHNSQELLRYTYQLSTVQEAINQWLGKIPSEQLLPSLCVVMDQFASHTDTWFFWNKRISKHTLRDWYGKKPTTTLGLLWQMLFWLFVGKIGDVLEILENNPQLKVLPHVTSLIQRLKTLYEIGHPTNIQDISDWYSQQKWLVDREADEDFRPQFLATLRQLYYIAEHVHRACFSSSQSRYSVALDLARKNLQSLAQNLTTICSPLEQNVMLNIVENWQEVVNRASQNAIPPRTNKVVRNPFVVGAPVSGTLFVGREDIFTELTQLWGDDATRLVDSVVLYGQRRVGKTSILINIGKQFGAKTVVVFINLQRLGEIEQEGELWGELAFTIYEALDQQGLLTDFEKPERDSFLDHPTFEMNRFITKVRSVLTGRRLLLALDEFETLERKIKEKKLPTGVIDYLRSLIHSEPWLVLTLAGLHTLFEMSRNYWNPLFASVRPIKVGFLTERYVEQLYVEQLWNNPYEDFPLGINRDTIQFIHQWTAGQPLLVQLIGSRLVRLHNSLLDQGVTRNDQFTIEDAQMVIFEQEFFTHGGSYFHGVWGQTEPGMQRQLLTTLAHYTSFEQPQIAQALVVEKAQVEFEEAQLAWKVLQRRDIVTLQEGSVQFTVPLMRHWVEEILGKEKE